jgi:hypothetical protein
MSRNNEDLLRNSSPILAFLEEEKEEEKTIFRVHLLSNFLAGGGSQTFSSTNIHLHLHPGHCHYLLSLPNSYHG